MAEGQVFNMALLERGLGLSGINGNSIEYMTLTDMKDTTKVLDLTDSYQIKLIDELTNQYTDVSNFFQMNDGTIYTNSDIMPPQSITFNNITWAQNDRQLKDFLNKRNTYFKLDLSVNGNEYLCFLTLGGQSAQINTVLYKNYNVTMKMMTRFFEVTRFTGNLITEFVPPLPPGRQWGYGTLGNIFPSQPVYDTANSNSFTFWTFDSPWTKGDGSDMFPWVSLAGIMGPPITQGAQPTSPILGSVDSSESYFEFNGDISPQITGYKIVLKTINFQLDESSPYQELYARNLNIMVDWSFGGSTEEIPLLEEVGLRQIDWLSDGGIELSNMNLSCVIDTAAVDSFSIKMYSNLAIEERFFNEFDEEYPDPISTMCTVEIIPIFISGDTTIEPDNVNYVSAGVFDTRVDYPTISTTATQFPLTNDTSTPTITGGLNASINNNILSWDTSSNPDNIVRWVLSITHLIIADAGPANVTLNSWDARIWCNLYHPNGTSDTMTLYQSSITNPFINFTNNISQTIFFGDIVGVELFVSGRFWDDNNMLSTQNDLQFYMGEIDMTPWIIYSDEVLPDYPVPATENSTYNSVDTGYPEYDGGDPPALITPGNGTGDITLADFPPHIQGIYDGLDWNDNKMGIDYSWYNVYNNNYYLMISGITQEQGTTQFPGLWIDVNGTEVQMDFAGSNNFVEYCNIPSLSYIRTNGVPSPQLLPLSNEQPTNFIFPIQDNYNRLRFDGLNNMEVLLLRAINII